MCCGSHAWQEEQDISGKEHLKKNVVLVTEVFCLSLEAGLGPVGELLFWLIFLFLSKIGEVFFCSACSAKAADEEVMLSCRYLWQREEDTHTSAVAHVLCLHS